MKKIFTFIGICSTVIVMAQPQKVVADKIIAQVGNKIILKSDIANAISDYRRQGQEASLPPNPECAFLEGQLIQKALVLQAEKDSLLVSEDEIEASLDNQIRGFIREYGSQQILEDVAGKTVYQIKEDFRQVFKERKLADLMRAKIVDNIKITPNEVRAFYEKIPKDSLAFYESELELKQIIMTPKANKSVDEYVIKQLYEYKRQIENGSKRFDQLAKIYTDDPGSKESGGQYTVNRNDKFWDPTFLSTCYRLKEGQTSNVIKSKFGYHIIQLVSRSGDDAVVRHILKIPPITNEEIKIVVNELDTVRERLVRKEMDFGYALNKYNDDEANKNNGGQIGGRDGSGLITIDQLDKEMVMLLKNLNPGEYSKPQVYTDERGTKKVRIIYFASRTDPHRENIKDDYNRLSQRAIEEKKQLQLEKWFAEHIPTYYITIDSEFTSCKSINNWLKYARKN
ncbi:MAG: peptidylprolyl isomerase [Chitinophagaceae bacterium]|nr:peptidylprolyl isomerase [Chitinophagaceae bacterium]